MNGKVRTELSCCTVPPSLERIQERILMILHHKYHLLTNRNLPVAPVFIRRLTESVGKYLGTHRGHDPKRVTALK